jgi:hypothetical protein
MQDFLSLVLLALCGIIFVVGCATPFILALALHIIN